MDKLNQVSYPDFKLLQTIDPNKFDQNNADLVGKIDEVVQYLNDLLKSLEGDNGASKIGTPPLNGISGTNVKEQLESICDFIDNGYYTKDEMLSGSSLAKGSEEWIAVEGQTVFNLTTGAYPVNKKCLSVIVGGVPQSITQFTENSSTKFTLNEGVPAGVKVRAEWFNAYTSQLATHGQDHAPLGADSLAAYYAKKTDFDEHTAENANQSVTEKQYEIVGDGTDELAKINTALDDANYGKLQFKKGTYKANGRVRFTKAKIVTGNKDAVIDAYKADSGGDCEISADNVYLKDLIIQSADTTQTVFTTGVRDTIEIDGCKITSASKGVHVNTQTKNIKIKKTNIVSDSYGILINSGTSNGENLIIDDCNIESDKSDGIELNCPTAPSFENVKIINNSVSSKSNGSGSTSGFAIGIARAKNVIIANNIIKESRNEAIHIEDAQENIAVTNNIVKNCNGDGVRILNKSGAIPVIVSNNHIVSSVSAWKTKIGINKVSDANGSLDNCIFTDNIIRGFDKGIVAYGSGNTHVDNNVIQDCNYGIVVSSQKALGNLIMSNVATLCRIEGSGIIENIFSSTVPTEIMEFAGTAGRHGGTIKKFNIPTETIDPIVGTNKIIGFTLPNRLYGKLKVYIINAGGTAGNNSYIYGDVAWDGTTFTWTPVYSKNNGNMSAPTVINEGGVLKIQFYGASDYTATSCILDFNGEYYKFL